MHHFEARYSEIDPGDNFSEELMIKLRNFPNLKVFLHFESLMVIDGSATRKFLESNKTNDWTWKLIFSLHCDFRPLRYSWWRVSQKIFENKFSDPKCLNLLKLIIGSEDIQHSLRFQPPYLGNKFRNIRNVLLYAPFELKNQILLNFETIVFFIFHFV